MKSVIILKFDVHKANHSLWLICLNNLLINLEKVKFIKVTAFADEISLIIDGNSERHLQSNLSNILLILENWCKKSGLTLNQNKLMVVNIGKRLKNKILPINCVNVNKFCKKDEVFRFSNWW